MRAEHRRRETTNGAGVDLSAIGAKTQRKACSKAQERSSTCSNLVLQRGPYVSAVKNQGHDVKYFLLCVSAPLGTQQVYGGGSVQGGGHNGQLA